MHYLLAAKTKIPHFSLDVIPRTRLAAQLELGARRKLTLVVAPAGFGKTLAVSTWLQTVAHPPPATPSVAWYALDENDHLPARFLTYLLEAVHAVYPDWGQEVAGLRKGTMEPVYVNVGGKRFVASKQTLQRGSKLFENLLYEVERGRVEFNKDER